MNYQLKILVVTLSLGICFLLAWLFVAYDAGLHQGKMIGAKIGMEGTYRIEEVRGSCDDLFTAGECVQCHTILSREAGGE